MKGDPEFIVLKHAAWMSAGFEKSILGAVIRHPLSPSTDHVPDFPLKYNKYDLQESTATDFVLANTVAAASEVSGAVTTVANFAVKGRTEDKIHLRGKLVRIKRLQQVGMFWAALRSDPAVKSIVPSWISFYNTWPVCMVVGIMICEDVELGRNTATSAQRRATGEVSAGAIALAAGAPNPLGDSADPKLTVDKSRQAATSFEARFGSSQIFAVELRKVTTKRFHWKELRLKSDGPGNVDPSRLASNEPDEDEDNDLDKPIDPEDLICIEIDSKDSDDMAR
ncbi:hypothetical protein DL768_010975 [Monosporascus sp. mg162]|nr:hypothetical protein DL768_010975 [Monosporascus sp. mg162]